MHIRLRLIACASVAAAALIPSQAHAVSIASYTGTNIPFSGFGGWSHDGDTLNDRIIPNTQFDNMLLFLPNSPTLTFTLSGAANLTSISILSNYVQNGIPGNLVSAKVTIGATSAVVASTGFGPGCGGGLCNELLVLPGSLSSLVTSSFTLSDFVADGIFSQYTSLGEVVVTGRDAGVIPEPATWMMMIAGFGLVGAAVRRRAVLA